MNDDKEAVIRLGNTLLARHGLTGWKIRYNHRLKLLVGQCKPSCRTLELSPMYLTRVDDPEVTRIILHEIAHALHYERIKDRDPLDMRPSESLGHGGLWQAIGAEIGYQVTASDLEQYDDDVKAFLGKEPKW